MVIPQKSRFTDKNIIQFSSVHAKKSTRHKECNKINAPAIAASCQFKKLYKS